MSVATSETHPIRVDVVPIDPLPGRLGLTFAPGKKGSSSLSSTRWERNLDADLRALAERFDTHTLVSLLRPYEYELLEIPDLPERAAEYGLRSVTFAIDDVSVPDPEHQAAFRTLIGELRDELADGRNVAVHCRGGLGRSGVVAACILVSEGWDPGEAIEHVRRHRYGAIETPEQEQYVREFHPVSSSRVDLEGSSI